MTNLEPGNITWSQIEITIACSGKDGYGSLQV